jgi:antitoxin HicB
MRYSDAMKRNETVKTISAQYVCTFRREPEGGYTIRCRAFPEIVSYSESLEVARRNAREAIELCLEVYREKGWPLPKSDSDPRKTIREMVPVKLARV